MANARQPADEVERIIGEVIARVEASDSDAAKAHLKTLKTVIVEAPSAVRGALATLEVKAVEPAATE